MIIEFRLTYAYSNFEPECHKASLNSDEAIQVFQEYPWEEQFAVIQSRNDDGKSSMIPEVQFITDDQRKLSISAITDSYFKLEAEQDNKVLHRGVSNDFYKKQSDVTPEFIIHCFFHNQWDDVISDDREWQEVLEFSGSTEEVKLLHQFDFKEWSLPFFAFVIPAIFLILYPIQVIYPFLLGSLALYIYIFGYNQYEKWRYHVYDMAKPLFILNIKDQIIRFGAEENPTVLLIQDLKKIDVFVAHDNSKRSDWHVVRFLTENECYFITHLTKGEYEDSDGNKKGISMLALLPLIRAHYQYHDYLSLKMTKYKSEFNDKSYREMIKTYES